MKPLGYESIPFDALRHNFVAPIKQLFGTDALDQLHEDGFTELFKVGADSATSFHKKFYDRYREGWLEMESLYARFIKEVVAPMFGGEFLFQKFPTFRVHLRNNVAVGAFHTDAEFGHPAGEVNFIIPLTNSQGTASVWVESAPGAKDYAPMELEVGTMIRFHGNLLSHGNKVNTTARTRVSMDFRILPAHCYHEDDTGISVTLGTKFREGAYYRRFRP